MNSDNITYTNNGISEVWKLFPSDGVPFYDLRITKEGENWQIDKKESNCTAHFYGSSLGEVMQMLLENKTGKFIHI